MRLFITGATGYIGLNVANTFRRAGYQVFGLVRSVDKAPLLERIEIIPVVGSLQKPHDFKDIAAQCDVIIHTALDRQADTETLDRNMVRFLLETIREAAQPKTLIYTSCIWVLGNSERQPLTEQSHISPPQELAWRLQVEKTVLNAEFTKGLVIRPGVVYGRQGGLTGMWFHGASNGGVIQIVGNGQNHWAMVHVNDLAQGYLLAAQRGNGGESFNLVDSTRSTVMAMVSAAAKAAGNIRQLEFIPKDEVAAGDGHTGCSAGTRSSRRCKQSTSCCSMATET